MDDLVRWLGEQLDTDAAHATAAAEEDGPDWHYDGRAILTRREGDLVAVGSQDFMEPGRGEHIATHDPARVLREIDAKRQILRHLESAEVSLRNTEPGRDPHELMTGATNTLRAVVKVLAVVYADRPGYREEWRP